MRRGRGVASALLAVSAASGAGAAWTAGLFAGARSTIETAELRTAVLSPRRAPEVLVGLVADTRLATRLEAFAATVPGEECLAVNAGSRVTFRHNDAQQLIPASTMKLLTARAAVGVLGEDATFDTIVMGPKPVSGTVAGDLVLGGMGDPLLSTPSYAASLKRPLKEFTDFDALVKATMNAGVRRVAGRIVGSDRRFDRERYVPSWKPDYARDGDVGPISALAVNDGYLSFGPRPVAAADPALVAAEMFRAGLIAAGVAVDGPAVSAPDDSSPERLTAVSSPPLSTIVRELLVESDNNTAELLLRNLVQRTGTAITRGEGIAALRTELAAQRLPAGDLVAIDGSGLDRGNRASCRLLLAALQPVQRHDTAFHVEKWLALAGRTGTLTDRFQGHRLAGKMRAKTGALAGVVGLVGVADENAATKLRFAFLANGSFTEAGGRQLQERLGSVLATYPDAPPAASVEP